jgi:antitoxin component of MazEF toxin-antitoxin module
MSLNRKIQRVGGSYGLTLPKSILDMIGWAVGDNLSLLADGDRIILRKCEAPKKEG